MGINQITANQKWMHHALDLAKQAEQSGEVPVGAVLVKDQTIIAQGFNQTIQLCDPTAHAEIIVLRHAAKQLGNHRLINTTLYVTLEPCIMCLGALIQARIETLVYAANEPNGGLIHNIFELLSDQLNHTIHIVDNVLADESSLLLKNFFASKR